MEKKQKEQQKLLTMSREKQLQLQEREKKEEIRKRMAKRVMRVWYQIKTSSFLRKLLVLTSLKFLSILSRDWSLYRRVLLNMNLIFPNFLYNNEHWLIMNSV